MEAPTCFSFEFRLQQTMKSNWYWRAPCIIVLLYCLTSTIYMKMAGQKMKQGTDAGVSAQTISTMSKTTRQLSSKGYKETDNVSASQHVPQISCNRSQLSCFQSYISGWSRDKPRAAILILTQSSHFYKLQRTLRSLHTYFLQNYRYPIIIFHEGEFSQAIPNLLRNFTNIHLFFQQITFEIPEFLTEPIPDRIPCYKPVGYRHMCRFQSKLVYEQPIIHELEYYWRLDDDSLLTNHVIYDVFHFMHIHGYEYGYRVLFEDQPRCAYGLWQAAREFTWLHKDIVNLRTFSKWPENQIFYNNFEISKVSFWLSDKYKTYIDFIDRKGGIYLKRWGDAPIKSIAIAMFLPPDKIYYFDDICYQHQQFQECRLTY